MPCTSIRSTFGESTIYAQISNNMILNNFQIAGFIPIYLDKMIPEFELERIDFSLVIVCSTTYSLINEVASLRPGIRCFIYYQPYFSNLFGYDQIFVV